MGRPKLSEAVLTQRQKDKQRKTQLFQRIKKVFKNSKLQDLINHTLANVSPYFIPNVATLTSWIFNYEPDHLF
jgi:hypothetical protein